MTDLFGVKTGRNAATGGKEAHDDADQAVRAIAEQRSRLLRDRASINQLVDLLDASERAPSSQVKLAATQACASLFATWAGNGELQLRRDCAQPQAEEHTKVHALRRAGQRLAGHRGRTAQGGACPPVTGAILRCGTVV